MDILDGLNDFDMILFECIGVFLNVFRGCVGCLMILVRCLMIFITV